MNRERSLGLSKVWKKRISSVVLTFFVMSMAGLQYIGAATNAGVINSKPSFASVNDILLAVEQGRILETYKGKGKRTIVCIQDLHCHKEVQDNTAEIIRVLKETYGNKMSNLFVEGAWSKIDLNFMKSMPNDFGVKENMIEDLIGLGLMSGAEKYASLDNVKTNVIGVEDEKKYKDDSVFLVKSLADRERAQKVIQLIREKLDQEKEENFSKDLKDFEKIVDDHKNKKINTIKYVRQLKKYSQKVGINFDLEYSNLSKLLTLVNFYMRLGKIDAIKAEAYDLQDQLADSLTKDQIARLDDLKKENNSRYYLYLSRIISDNNIKIKDVFGLLYRYFQYLNLSKSLNTSMLVDEERKAQEKIKSFLTLTNKQRDIINLDRILDLYENFINNSVTNKESAEFMAGQAEYDKTINDYINNYTSDLLWAYQIKTLMPVLNKGVELMDDFYACAGDRNNSLVSNTLRHKDMVSVMVVGGYHTDGITQLLRSKGISYVLIAPNITEAYDNTIYEQRLKDQYSIVSPEVKSGASRLASMTAATVLSWLESNESKDLSNEDIKTELKKLGKDLDDNTINEIVDNSDNRKQIVAKYYTERMREFMLAANLSPDAVLKFFNMMQEKSIGMKVVLKPSEKAVEIAGVSNPIASFIRQQEGIDIGNVEKVERTYRAGFDDEENLQGKGVVVKEVSDDKKVIVPESWVEPENQGGKPDSFYTNIGDRTVIIGDRTNLGENPTIGANSFISNVNVQSINVVEGTAVLSVNTPGEVVESETPNIIIQETQLDDGGVVGIQVPYNWNNDENFNFDDAQYVTYYKTPSGEKKEGDNIPEEYQTLSKLRGLRATTVREDGREEGRGTNVASAVVQEFGAPAVGLLQRIVRDLHDRDQFRLTDMEMPLGVSDKKIEEEEEDIDLEDDTEVQEQTGVASIDDLLNPVVLFYNIAKFEPLDVDTIRAGLQPIYREFVNGLGSGKYENLQGKKIVVNGFGNLDTGVITTDKYIAIPLGRLQNLWNKMENGKDPKEKNKIMVEEVARVLTHEDSDMKEFKSLMKENPDRDPAAAAQLAHLKTERTEGEKSDEDKQYLLYVRFVNTVEQIRRERGINYFNAAKLKIVFQSLMDSGADMQNLVDDQEMILKQLGPEIYKSAILGQREYIVYTEGCTLEQLKEKIRVETAEAINQPGNGQRLVIEGDILNAEGAALSQNDLNELCRYMRQVFRNGWNISIGLGRTVSKDIADKKLFIGEERDYMFFEGVSFLTGSNALSHRPGSAVGGALVKYADQNLFKVKLTDNNAIFYVSALINFQYYCYLKYGEKPTTEEIGNALNEYTQDKNSLKYLNSSKVEELTKLETLFNSDWGLLQMDGSEAQIKKFMGEVKYMNQFTTPLSTINRLAYLDGKAVDALVNLTDENVRGKAIVIEMQPTQMLNLKNGMDAEPIATFQPPLTVDFNELSVWYRLFLRVTVGVKALEDTVEQKAGPMFELLISTMYGKDRKEKEQTAMFMTEMDNERREALNGFESSV